MAMHSDHPATRAEDAALDATMKIVGMVTVLLVIAGAAFWYIYL